MLKSRLTVLFASVLILLGVTLAVNRMSPRVCASDEAIPIDSDTFPDDALRRFVKEKYDRRTPFGYLSQDETDPVREIEINATNYPVKNFDGLIYFPNLESLDVTGTPAKKLYLYSLNNLTNVTFRNSSIETLSLENLPMLSVIDGNDSALSSIVGLNKCSHLDTLYLANTKLTSISLKGLSSLRSLCLSQSSKFTTIYDGNGAPNLAYLYVEKTAISSISVYSSVYPSLLTLWCGSNTLTSVRLGSESGNITLQDIRIQESPNLTTNISFGRCRDLRSVYLQDLGISKVEFSGASSDSLYITPQLQSVTIDNCPNLTEFRCNYTKLESLSITSCKNIQAIRCYNNAISNLTLSSVPSLRELNLKTNRLTSFNANAYSNLEELGISWNPIPSLDVSKLTKLRDLNFGTTNIAFKSVKLPNTTTLEMLAAYGIQSASLDISKYTNLVRLELNQCKITSIDLSKQTKLQRFFIDGCSQLKSLDLSKNTKLYEVDCGYNSNLSSLIVKSDNLHNLTTAGTKISVVDIASCPQLVALVNAHPPIKTTDSIGNPIYVSVDSANLFNYLDYPVTAKLVKTKPSPSKPTGVKAVSETSTRVKVSWNAVSGANGYEVSRAESANGPFVVLGSVSETSRACPGLVSGKMYFFRVRSYITQNGLKYFSAYSTVVSAVPQLPAPSSLKVSTKATTSITLSWNAVSGASGYEVYRATSSNGTYSKLGEVTTTSRKCPGLSSGKKYFFKVRAFVTINGTKYFGAYSSVVSDVTLLAAPTVKISATTTTSITLSWNAVSGATGYEAYRSTSANGTFSKMGEVTTTSRKCPGLTSRKTYYFKVRAFVEIGGVRYYGPYSTVVSGKTK